MPLCARPLGGRGSVPHQTSVIFCATRRRRSAVAELFRTVASRRLARASELEIPQPQTEHCHLVPIPRQRGAYKISSDQIALDCLLRKL